MMKNQCACNELSYQVYECTITGGGATIWKGTAFECSAVNNRLIFLHNRNSARQECNNGAISGLMIRAENNCYTSQLRIRNNFTLNGRSIVCAHDSGVNVTEVGSVFLSFSTGIRFYIVHILNLLLIAVVHACSVLPTTK